MSNVQQEQILSSAGLLTTNQTLNASLVEEAILISNLSGAKAEAVLTELGLINAKTGNIIVTNKCTMAEVAQALATQNVVGADAEAILAQLGLATANTTTTTSFAVLTNAVKANAAAIGKWLVTNPIGWCIIAIGAIYGVTKAYDALTVSETEIAEAHKKSVDKAKQSISEYENLKQELETIQQTYDDNKEKLEHLYTLRKNQTITQAEKDYLEELEGQNEELKKQVEYKQALANIESLEAENDAVESLNQKTQLGNQTGQKFGVAQYEQITSAEKIKQNTALINFLTSDLMTYKKVIREIDLSQEEIDKYTNELVACQEQLNSVKGNDDSANAKREFYQKRIEEIQSLLNATVTYEQYENKVSETSKEIQSLISENNDLLQEVEPLNDAIKSTSGENYKLKKSNDEIIASAKDAAIEFNEYTESLNTTSDALFCIEKNGNNTPLSFDKAFNSSNFSELKDNLLDLASAGELTPEVLSSTEEYTNLLKSLGLTAEDGANSLKKFFGELDYSNMMEGLEDSIGGVIKAQYELAKNGKLSFDTTKNLLSIYPELIEQLDSVEGGYITTDAALQVLIDTKLENYKLNNNKLIDSANNIITSLGGEAIAYGLTTEEIKKQIKAQIALIQTKIIQYEDSQKNSYDQLMPSSLATSFHKPIFNEAYGNKTPIALSIDKYKELLSELQNILDSIDTSDKNLQNAQEIYEKLKESIWESYSNSSSSSSTSDTTDYWKQEFDNQLSLLKHQLSMNQITAAKYYNELDKLNNKYFANNAKYLSEYRQYEEEVYNGLISLQDNALNSIHKLIDLREDMIRDMKQKEIDAIEDIIKAEKDKLDAINESIDARKKAIELLRDEKDHEKEMSEKNKTISDLQIKLEALKYDNSASAHKKRRELEEELAKARTDLADYIADYEYDKALEALDNEADLAEKQYEQQEETLQNQIDSIEAYLDDEKQLMQDAINDINGMNNSLFEDMKNWAYETTGEVWEVVEAWKEAKEALEMYNAVNKVPEIHKTLHNNSQNGVATAIGATSSIGGKTISNSTSSANSNSQTDSNNSSGYKAVHTIVKNDTLWTLAQKYYGDGTKWTKIQKANSDVDPYKLQIGKKLYIPYRKGIKKVPQNQLALTDEAGDELTLHANEKGNLQMLTKGSSVIPADITENLVKWGKVAPDLFMQNLQPFISPMIIHEFTPKEASPTVNIGDININGNIGSLTKSDLNEFRKDIVNDVYDSMQKNRVKSGRY